jgi:hypothetical protein
VELTNCIQHFLKVQLMVSPESLKAHPITLNLWLCPITCRNIATCFSIVLLMLSHSKPLALKRSQSWKNGALLILRRFMQRMSSDKKMKWRLFCCWISLSNIGPYVIECAYFLRRLNHTKNQTSTTTIMTADRRWLTTTSMSTSKIEHID